MFWGYWMGLSPPANPHLCLSYTIFITEWGSRNPGSRKQHWLWSWSTVGRSPCLARQGVQNTALSSLPFWNVPLLHFNHPSARAHNILHSWDLTLSFHWIWSSFLTIADHLHSPISVLRAPLPYCARRSNARLLAKICQGSQGGQLQPSSPTGAKGINCTASKDEELI